MSFAQLITSTELQSVQVNLDTGQNLQMATAEEKTYAIICNRGRKKN